MVTLLTLYTCSIALFDAGRQLFGEGGEVRAYTDVVPTQYFPHEASFHHLVRVPCLGLEIRLENVEEGLETHPGTPQSRGAPTVGCENVAYPPIPPYDNDRGDRVALGFKVA